MMANHEDRKILLGNELIEIKRGSFITSELKLMNRWGWSKTKVRNFLELLESDNMVIKKADTKKTTLTIVNYNDYQDTGTTEEPEKDQEETTIELPTDCEETTKRHKQELKNYKELKNDKKNIYAEFVSMTEDEYNKLIERHGETLTRKMIDALDNYKGSTGKKYKSDYRAILSWVEDKVLKEGEKGGKGSGANNNGDRGNEKEGEIDSAERAGVISL